MKLSDAVKALTEAKIDNAKGEARMLFSHFGNFSSADLLFGDPELSDARLTEAVKKRTERFPLQYIIGKVDFYRESYKVTEGCLIPRSDTEILVDEAVKRLPEGENLIDLCTGSGCVALSTLNNTSSTTAIGADISENALSVAKENAAALGLSDRICFVLADVLNEPLCEKVYAVLSNPPYVSRSAYAELEPEIYHEPNIAFIGGEDGLDFYRRLIPLYKGRLKKGGFFAFEIGFDQGEALVALAEENRLDCEIIKDYNALPRVAILTQKD